MKHLKHLFHCAALLFALMSGALAHAATTTTYYHNDLLGSPVAATDASGHVIWRESYRPYGERLTNDPASTGNDVWYTSRRQDADTGLVYMGARYYDPVAGRFVSKDPVGFDEGNIQSFNRYAYANDNPYKYVDPDGRVVVDVLFVAYDVYELATEGATTTNVIATGLDVASTFGLGFGAGEIYRAGHAAVEIGSVTSKELRAAGRADFEASKAEKLGESGGKCVYCNVNDASTGDHVRPLKQFADDVNAGRITREDAIRAASAPDNIVGACRPCNSSKGARELSDTPGPGKFVPPNRRLGD